MKIIDGPPGLSDFQSVVQLECKVHDDGHLGLLGPWLLPAGAHSALLAIEQQRKEEPLILH